MTSDNQTLSQTLNQTKQLLNDKELTLLRLRTHFKETLSKLLLFLKLQTSKHRSELDFLKRHFLSELDLNKKHFENMLSSVLSKSREVQIQGKYKIDKVKYMFEQKFKDEFSKREQEWETAWEKREDAVTLKDRSIKELEQEKLSMKESIHKLELEL